MACTALQHERAEARENNGLHDITRSCLSLVRVRHCSSTLSSDRIFIKINIHTNFHTMFHLLFSAERGISLFAHSCTFVLATFTGGGVEK